MIALSAARPLTNKFQDNSGLHATSLAHQIKILLRRGYIMCKRDTVRTLHINRDLISDLISDIILILLLNNIFK